VPSTDMTGIVIVSMNAEMINHSYFCHRAISTAVLGGAGHVS
jgi:hypothetical protein